MSRIKLSDRILLVELYFKNNESPSSTIRAYKRHKSMKNSKDPFSRQALDKIISRFRATGSVADLSGRGRKSIFDEKIMEINSSVELSAGRTSIRSISHATDIPKSVVQRVLAKQLKLKPYKFEKVQVLTDEHKGKRRDFCLSMLQKINSCDVYLPNVLFSDEATFSLSGTVSSHQFRIWSNENPHVKVELPRHSPSITIWVGYTQHFRIGPYFFESTVTGDNYRELLTKEVIPFLKTHRKLKRTTFQQDGAPSHTAMKTIELLTKKSHFEKRVLSLRTESPWPANSPDLSPLDYFYWNQMRTSVYRSNPTSMQQLKQLIRQFAEDIDKALLHNSIENLKKRLILCLAVDGGHFE